jgi:transcriptional regulator with XRE-family HTH domain
MCYNNVIKEKENPKMNSKQIVAEVMNLRGWSQKKLAEKLGYATVTGVANRLNGKNTKDMNVATLVEFLSLMECEVVVRSTTKDKKEWVISLDEKEGE